MSDTPSRAENKADSPNKAVSAPADPAVGGRIALMYGFSRRYTSLPFAVFCLAVALLDDYGGWYAYLPIGLMLIVVGAGLGVDRRYRARGGAPVALERQFILLSAFAGATWGIGVAFWYVPGDFSAQACLCLAYLGMAAVEFFAHSVCRPAYLVHAALSLGPLMLRLLMQPDVEHIVAAAILFCFLAALMGVGQRFWALIVEGTHSDAELAGLQCRLAESERVQVAARDGFAEDLRKKDEFLAAVSYEMRTSLTALLGVAQILDAAELTAEQRYQARMLLEAGQGFKTLLDDVVAMSEVGREVDPRQECDPVQIARSVMHLMQPVAWGKQLELTLTTAGALPRIALGPFRLRQALSKLVENALKFTNAGSVAIRIEPVSRQGKAFVRFSVSDTGPGVPPELTSGLFQPPKGRTAASRFVRRRGGAGFGLVVVRCIVDAAGGVCGFDTRLGAGSSFWFSLPAAGTAEDVAPVGEAGPVPTGMRLIVCMGDDIHHKELEEILQPHGNRLYFARSPVDLVGRAGHGGFDAAIVRADLADMLAAAPGVKLPILALSAAGERAPAAAAAHLAWPCAAFHVYGALTEMGRRAQDPDKPTPEPAPDALDAAALSALEKSVGKETLIEILKAYLDTAEAFCAAAREAAARTDWERAEGCARDIVGSASGLGLAAVTASARALSGAVRAHAEAPALESGLQAMLADEERTRKALHTRYPELT